MVPGHVCSHNTLSRGVWWGIAPLPRFHRPVLLLIKLTTQHGCQVRDRTQNFRVKAGRDTFSPLGIGWVGWTRTNDPRFNRATLYHWATTHCAGYIRIELMLFVLETNVLPLHQHPEFWVLIMWLPRRTNFHFHGESIAQTKIHPLTLVMVCRRTSQTMNGFLFYQNDNIIVSQLIKPPRVQRQRYQ